MVEKTSKTPAKAKKSVEKGSLEKSGKVRSSHGQQLRLLSKQLKRVSAVRETAVAAPQEKNKKSKAKRAKKGDVKVKNKSRQAIIADNLAYFRCL